MKSWTGPIILTLILVGYWILSPSAFLNPLNSNRGADDVGPRVAKILNLEGNVLHRGQTETFFQQASKGLNLFPFHKVLTGANGKVLIDLGEKFWLLNNSEIRLDRDQGKTTVHLLSGAIERGEENIADTLRFQVGKEIVNSGGLIKKSSILQLTSLPLSEIRIDEKMSGGTAYSSRLPEVKSQQIYETFRLHQKFIEKCFISHYSRANGQTQSGNIWIRFNIKKTGRLDAPQVSRSDYKDEKFHHCIQKVVERVQIKDFKSAQTTVEFPIQISMPQ